MSGVQGGSRRQLLPVPTASSAALSQQQPLAADSSAAMMAPPPARTPKAAPIASMAAAGPSSSSLLATPSAQSLGAVGLAAQQALAGAGGSFSAAAAAAAAVGVLEHSESNIRRSKRIETLAEKQKLQPLDESTGENDEVDSSSDSDADDEDGPAEGRKPRRFKCLRRCGRRIHRTFEDLIHFFFFSCWGITRAEDNEHCCGGWYGFIFYLGIRGRKCGKRRVRGSIVLPFCGTHRMQWLMSLLRISFVLINYLLIDTVVARAVVNAQDRVMHGNTNGTEIETSAGVNEELHDIRAGRVLSHSMMALLSACFVTIVSSLFDYFTSWILDGTRVASKKPLAREMSARSLFADSDEEEEGTDEEEAERTRRRRKPGGKRPVGGKSLPIANGNGNGSNLTGPGSVGDEVKAVAPEEDEPHHVGSEEDMDSDIGGRGGRGASGSDDEDEFVPAAEKRRRLAAKREKERLAREKKKQEKEREKQEKKQVRKRPAAAPSRKKAAAPANSSEGAAAVQVAATSAPAL